MRSQSICIKAMGMELGPRPMALYLASRMATGVSLGGGRAYGQPDVAKRWIFEVDRPGNAIEDLKSSVEMPCACWTGS